jgi:putative CocE/NonD family hydrolase
VPAYVCASWSSDLHIRGSLNAFRSISSKHKWLEIHGRKEWETFYSREAVERQRRFMDHFLKGEDTGILDTPRVRIEVRDRFYDSITRFASDWPVPGTEYRKLYLDIPDRALSTTAAPAATVRYSALASGNDKAEFSLTFYRRTEVVGHMKLRLWVSAEGADDMDIHAGVRKIDRRGREVHFPDFDHFEQGMVASGWQRASHRELDDKRSTPWQPWLKHERLVKLAAGEIVPLEIEILPSGTVFNAGEQLRLVLQGHDIIDFWYRHSHKETVNRGSHVIHAGGSHDSHLLVPVVPG